MALRFTFNGTPWEVSDFGIDLQSLSIGMGNTLTVKFGANLLAVSANPPAAPSNLNAVASSLTVVTATWLPSQNHEATYVIYRSADGVTYTEVGTTINTIYTHSDDIDSTVEHWYKVIARNHFGDSDPIIFHYVPSGSAPAAPSLLVATAHGTSQIDLAWTDNASNETGFKVERSPAGVGTWVEIDTTVADVVAYQSTGLTAATAYDFRVRAYNTYGNSAYSNTATATTDSNPASPPAAPSNPTATALNSHSIRVGWTDNSTDETGFEVHWSDTQNGTYVLLTTTNANIELYDNDGLNPQQTRWYKIRAVNASGASAFTTPEVSATTPSADVNVLPDLVSAARAKADANTAEWQAFDTQYGTDAVFNALNIGSWQTSSFYLIGAWALGYQCLKVSNPTKAAKYAKKAISFIRQILQEYGSGVALGSWGYQYLARGDGVTKTFTLPNAPVGTFACKLGTMVHKTMTRGAGNSDTVAYYQKFIKVSNTLDGPANYTEGVDWRHSGLLTNDQIDWSLGGSKPATSATYYVSYSTTYGVANQNPANYTQSGTTLTFNTAPTTGQAIFVSYVYGTDYLQTMSDGGGYNTIFVDSGYNTRNLAWVPCAYDWLYDYSGFDSSLKTAIEDLMILWAARAYSGAYQAGALGGNYGCGHYFFLCACAAALEGTRAEATTVLNYALAHRTSTWDIDYRSQPGTQLSGGNAIASYLGGFFGEGWSYGGLATQNILVASDILNQSGHLDNSSEKAWATEVAKCLAHGHPDISRQYNGGDWNTYLLQGVPPRANTVVLQKLADSQAAREWTAYLMQNGSGDFSAHPIKLLYYDSTTPTNWGLTEPLGYISAGNGLVFSRADWTYTSTFVTFDFGNTIPGAHFRNNVGQVQIWRGLDDLLVFGCQRAGVENYPSYSQYSNTIMIDDGGAGQQTYRFSQSITKYGPLPGVILTASEIQTAYSYAVGNGTTAWYKDATHNPCLEFTRFWLHVRPDYMFVFDRVQTKAASYPKQLQWHAYNAFTLVGTDGWKTTKGSSTLFGQTYSNRTLTTQAVTVTISAGPPAKTCPQVNSNPAVLDSDTIRYATVFQSSPSSTLTIDGNEYIVASGDNFEGIRIGTVAALFPTSGAAAAPISYSLTQSGDTTHYVCGLIASHTYTLGGDAAGSVAATAAGVLKFTVTSSGAKSVTVTA